MNHPTIQECLPGFLRKRVLHFESVIDDSIAAFSKCFSENGWILDAGAGECQYKHYFAQNRYVGVDLMVGDASWNYRALDVIADLSALPFSDSCFDGCINVVTLEHLPQPLAALREMNRVLKPGSRLLLIAPQEWEVHQSPHDFFRYTRHGLEYLLRQAGFTDLNIAPVGGYFRLMARRLLNGLQFFPGILFLPAAFFLVPPALVLSFFDGFDRQKNFTLGYVCHAAR